MLKTHLHLCLGITNTTSCHTRLTQTSWPKPSKSAATAHTGLPLVPWKDKFCCCSSGGFRGTKMWRADRGQLGNLLSLQVSFSIPAICRPVLAAPGSALFPGLRASLHLWDPRECHAQVQLHCSSDSNSSSLSLGLGDRTAHTVISLMSNLCFLR